jgi:hypothetical protein
VCKVNLPGKTINVPFKSVSNGMVEFEYKVIVESSLVKELTEGKLDLGLDVKITETKQNILEE